MKFTLISLAAAVIIFAGTTWLTFNVNRRRFERNNQAGVQVFSSYGHSIATRWIEKLVMLFARPIKWASVILFIGSLIGLAKHY